MVVVSGAVVTILPSFRVYTITKFHVGKDSKVNIILYWIIVRYKKSVPPSL